MILEKTKTSSGDDLYVEEVRYLNAHPRTVIRVGRSPHVQSVLPPFPGHYYDAVAIPGFRGSLAVVGVAGGTAAHVGRSCGYRTIYGIEHDPEMIRLGRKYFDLDGVFDRLIRGDAYDFEAWSELGWHLRFSCILFDAYRGLEHSEKLYQVTYLRFLVSRLEEDGTLLINATSFARSQSLSAALSLVGLGIRWEWKSYADNWVASVTRPRS